jgi:REP element-mobilizing transposase RayT
MSKQKFQNKYRISSARAYWHDYNGGLYFITICTAGKEQYFGEIVDGIMYLNTLGDKLNQIIAETKTHNHYAEIHLHQIMPNHLHLIVCIDERLNGMDMDMGGVDGDGDGNGNGNGNGDGVGVGVGVGVGDGDFDGNGVGNGDGVGDGYGDGDGVVVGNGVGNGNGDGNGDGYGDGRDVACRVSTGKPGNPGKPGTPGNPRNLGIPENAEQPIPQLKNEKMQLIAEKCGLLSTTMGGLKSATTRFANNHKITFGWQERFHDHIIRNQEEYDRIAIYIENNPTLWEQDKFYTK